MREIVKRVLMFIIISTLIFVPSGIVIPAIMSISIAPIWRAALAGVCILLAGFILVLYGYDKRIEALQAKLKDKQQT